jgi:hypothetical protein
MNLTELKKKPIGELIKIAEFMGHPKAPCNEW